MRDVLEELLAVWRAGGTAGLATVVRTMKSAPRPPGAAMVVAPDGSVAGSVSGGCVEAAVYEVANDVVATGRPELQSYGVSDDDAFSVGLTCGGTIEVFTEPVSRITFPQLQSVADDIAAHRAIAVATVIAHPDPRRLGLRLLVGEASAQGSLGSARADDAVADDARGLLAAGRSAVLSYGADGQRQDAGMEVFVASHAPRPRMLVFGAIDFAAALAQQGAFLGYRVTVCDARPVFATAARFPAAEDVVVEWPDRYLAAQAELGAIDARTAICVLTHDPKFDVPVLEVALRLPEVGYIGVMGSRRTHEDRLRRMREAGLTDTELARLASPIGLDLGARTPEETAVSIAAEIIARRWGGGGRPLTEVGGRIHHEA
ncbi:XdhC family protein [Mycolicibacterium hippocampi]|uniref:Xanthine dehydrogenase n=1 Tax=Mycolicibacterium hippocampi TaxID=659824 RepID=A0A7I9ZWA9_9MYCO|nr:XdhC/CoxI family protein [Mycolicibacterium hippocampi]GFH05295.1 xanthine dehydrogenase [Mycolicibacterium hippocampi]